MTRPLWTLEDVVAAAGGQLDAGSSSREMAGGPEGVPSAAREAGLAREAIITGISIDTRTLEPGDLFVPLTDARDGHEFVSAAFARGSVAAFVRESYARKPGDGLLVRVPDVPGRDSVLAALERIGMAARARLSASARVIAVTGSAGKTGTKEMLRACLRTCATAPGKVHAPEKSFNNHWGVPLTLARMPADTQFAVFEIGMNHAGEIRPLTRMVRPHVAIVTNVLPVHVGNFPDGEIGVANAKAEIFEGLAAPVPLSPSLRGEGCGEGQPHGTAIVPRDSPHFELLNDAARKQHAHLVTFGRSLQSDVKLGNVSGLQANGCQFVTVRLADETSLGFDMGLIGDHVAFNAMAVVAALATLGCDLKQSTAALADVRAAAGRGARLQLGGPDGILLLDESYNANPASMAAALANLQAVDPDGRRIAVMGDMLELGENALPYHRGLRDAAAGAADVVFCCGPMMRHLFDALPPEKRGAWAPASAELIAPVLAALAPGDAVMVKGSLGSRMAPIVDAIKKRFAPLQERG